MGQGLGVHPREKSGKGSVYSALMLIPASHLAGQSGQ
jgi:hypothetical protein